MSCRGDGYGYSYKNKNNFSMNLGLLKNEIFGPINTVADVNSKFLDFWAYS